MNASVLLLSSALLAGADPAPGAAAPVVAAPIVGVAAGCGCSAPVSCAPSCHRVGLLDRLRARLASFHRPRCHSACAPACAPAPTPCCAPAPAPAPCCGTPIFTGFTTSCHDPCDRHGLLARLRAKFHGSRHCDACSVGCGAGCAPAVGTVLPATPTPAVTPPDAMPKPGTPKTDPPKT